MNRDIRWKIEAVPGKLTGASSFAVRVGDAQVREPDTIRATAFDETGQAISVFEGRTAVEVFTQMVKSGLVSVPEEGAGVFYTFSKALAALADAKR